MDAAQFYEGPYAALSNFSAHQVEFQGHRYATAEHAYQAAKFSDPVQREKIASAPSAWLAREYGQSLSGRTPQFQKVPVMKEILRAKLLQHQDVRDTLRLTGERPIEKNHPLDPYWGSGKDGQGENIMGQIWMELRSELLNS